MIVTYTDTFINKISISNYPLKGFWIQLVNNIFQDTYQNWLIGSSDLSTVDSFIYDDLIRISFKSTNVNEISNLSKNSQLYLFCIDRLMYDDISDFSSIKDSKLFQQLAAVISMEEGDNIEYDTTNIINLPIDGGIKASIEPCYSPEHINVAHYNSIELGQKLVYDIDTDDYLIDKESAKHKLLEQSIRYKKEDLLNTMTIKQTGLFRL